MKNLDLIWKKVLTSIKKEITPTSFKTWFMPLKAVKLAVSYFDACVRTMIL